METGTIRITPSALKALLCIPEVHICSLCGLHGVTEDFVPSFWLPISVHNVEETEVLSPICLDCAEEHCVIDAKDGETVMKSEAVDRFHARLRELLNQQGTKTDESDPTA